MAAARSSSGRIGRRNPFLVFLVAHESTRESGASDPRDLGQMIEMAIAGAKRKIVLQHEGGDP